MTRSTIKVGDLVRYKQCSWRTDTIFFVTQLLPDSDYKLVWIMVAGTSCKPFTEVAERLEVIPMEEDD